MPVIQPDSADLSFYCMFPGIDQSHPYLTGFASVSFIEVNLDQKTELEVSIS